MGGFNINDTLTMARNKLAWLITVFFSKKKSIASLLTHTKPVEMLLIAVLVVMASFYGSVFIQEASTKPSSIDIQNPSPSKESSANLNQAPTVQDDLQKAEVKGARVVSNPTPTIIYAPPSTPTPTFDPDPIVNCNFTSLGTKRMKSTECSKSFECQVGQQWYIYTSRDKCTQDQATNLKQQYNNNSNYKPIPTYPPCTVYYSALGYSQTYSYTSPEECSKLQKESAIPTFDPDPYVTCQSKGEDLVIKQSVCSSLVDCQMGSEYFLLPPADCTRLQQEYSEEQQTSNTNESQSNIESECQRTVAELSQGVQAKYGGTTSTADALIQIIQGSCYSRCLSTGSYPDDCGKL